jgi:CHAT domain-containing protein
MADLLAGGLGRYRALHLATHARVYEGAEGHSTIRLAGAGDAPLTIDEIMACALSADVVYLSSCEGARRHRSAGRGVVSFAEAFLAAGAARVVASSILVEDDAGRALAEAFYRRWPAETSRAAALRAALREVRGQSRWSHPFYWGFVSVYARPAS